MLKRYDEFILENAINSEYKLYYSDNFRNILLEFKSDYVSALLLEAEDNDDAKGDFTLIDTSERNDQVTFIQSNRIPSLDDVENSPYWISPKRTVISVGRLVRRILTDILNVDYREVHIETFVNLYKSTYMNSRIEARLELVSGEDIRKWYSSVNYFNQLGTLGNSCMKHPSKSSFFDIYVKNPEVCKLLIMRSEEDNEKIVARALIWKLTDGTYYQDRVYHNRDYIENLFTEWAIKNNMKFFKLNRDKLSVQLGNHVYNEYPYMDTFACYDVINHRLHSDDNMWPSKGIYYLKSTDGGYDDDTWVYSNYYGEYVPLIDCIMTEDGDYVYSYDAIQMGDGLWYIKNGELVIYSDPIGQFIFKSDCFYSGLQDTYIHKDRAVEVVVNSPDIKISYVDKDELKYLAFNHDGVYYSNRHNVLDLIDNSVVNLHDKKMVSELKAKYEHLYKYLTNRDELKKRLLYIYNNGEYDRDLIIARVEDSSAYKGYKFTRNFSVDSIIIFTFTHLLNNTTEGTLGGNIIDDPELDYLFNRMSYSGRWYFIHMLCEFNYSGISEELFIINTYNKLSRTPYNIYG